MKRPVATSRDHGLKSLDHPPAVDAGLRAAGLRAGAGAGRGAGAATCREAGTGGATWAIVLGAAVGGGVAATTTGAGLGRRTDARRR